MMLTSDALVEYLQKFVENGGALWVSFRNDIKKENN
jgi:hypothetical protein